MPKANKDKKDDGVIDYEEDIEFAENPLGR